MSVQTEGALFEAVQKARLFTDSKFFVDAIPKGDVLPLYEAEKDKPDFDLKAFILEHFELPQEQIEEEKVEKEMDEHIAAMWDVLHRPLRDGKDSTLIDLPHSHIVPGGRFRECYYWDSYFTCEGLICAGKLDIVKEMIANFAFLIDTYGYIPNGNRTYYLSRSQQPYFSHLLALLHQHDPDLALSYFSQLEKEYAYWVASKNDLTAVKPRAEHCVLLDDDLILNRYFDHSNTPRPEAYLEDLHTFDEANENQRKNLYRNLRSACESGWDFSSRWLKDHTNLCTIRTTDLVPIDLNCLLFHTEELLADFAKIKGDLEKSLSYDRAAALRKRAIERYLWHKDHQFYFDYDFPEKHQSDNWTLAGVFPLFVKLSTKEQSDKIAEHIAHRFLMGGGLLTTTQRSNQQWDAPNGWAPLQWIAVKGLLNYNHVDLAKEIAAHWLSLNRDVFNTTHKMLEKYNVVDASEEAMAGEYAMQEGFGWTNAVALLFEELVGAG